MRCAAWRAFVGSFVLFLLSVGACHYEEQDALRRLQAEEAEAAMVFYCGAEPLVSDWAALGPLLLIASLSVAAGGAVRWWRAEVVGETDVRTLVLGIGGGVEKRVEAVGRARDAAAEKVSVLPAANFSPADAHPFEHFDERGLSPLERVLAED